MRCANDRRSIENNDANFQMDAMDDLRKCKVLVNEEMKQKSVVRGAALKKRKKKKEEKSCGENRSICVIVLKKSCRNFLRT